VAGGNDFSIGRGAAAEEDDRNEGEEEAVCFIMDRCGGWNDEADMKFWPSVYGFSEVASVMRWLQIAASGRQSRRSAASRAVK